MFYSSNALSSQRILNNFFKFEMNRVKAFLYIRYIMLDLQPINDIYKNVIIIRNIYFVGTQFIKYIIDKLLNK